MSKIANGVWFTIALVALMWAAFSNLPTRAMFLVVDHIAHYTGYPVAWLIVLMIVYGVGLLLVSWQRRKAHR
jgi:hypothetical protein